jgi:hypothetical protein
LADFNIDIKSFDIQRLVTVFPDRPGMRWWMLAWFNGKEQAESSVEIQRQTAIMFLHDKIDKDTMLEEYYPKQMEAYHNAIEQTKEQLLKQLIL